MTIAALIESDAKRVAAELATWLRAHPWLAGFGPEQHPLLIDRVLTLASADLRGPFPGSAPQAAALENIRLLAARHRKEPWSADVLRFCAEGGAVASPLRRPNT